MNAALLDTIKGYSNEYLIEQFYRHADQYREEALSLMQEELSRRGISPGDIDATKAPAEDGEAAVVHYDKKDFTKLEGGFTTNDSLLVRSMLTEHNIPFFLDASSSLLPFNGEELDAHLVTMHVHSGSLEAAQAIICEHFELSGARYNLKYADTKARLQSFNFYEIPHALLESKEIVEVVFSTDEKKLLINLGSRLIDEVEEIETKRQRVVFYYDALDDLISRLSAAEEPEFTHTDLLAILELLQIYCEDPIFVPIGSGLAEALMGFFSFSPQGG